MSHEVDGHLHAILTRPQICKRLDPAVPGNDRHGKMCQVCRIEESEREALFRAGLRPLPFLRYLFQLVDDAGNFVRIEYPERGAHFVQAPQRLPEPRAVD